MGQRLLLVDSDRSFLKEHQVSLEAAFDLELAGAPEGVLAKLETGAFAAVFICVEVADNKGYALCSSIRKNPRLDGVKIVLISAKATEEEYRRHQSLKGRADLYLHKPMAPSALVAALAPLVPGRTLDPDNPLGELVDTELGDDWLDNLKGALDGPAAELSAAPVFGVRPPSPVQTTNLDRGPALSTDVPPDSRHVRLLEDQVANLHEEMRAKDQRLAAAEERLRAAEAEAQQVQRQLNSVTLNLDELERSNREAETLKARLAETEAALRALEETRGREGESAETLKAQLKEALTERTDLIQQVETLNQQVGEKAQRAIELLKERDRLLHETMDLEPFKGKARELEAALAEKEAALAAQQQDHAAALAGKDEAFGALQQEHAAALAGKDEAFAAKQQELEAAQVAQTQLHTTIEELVAQHTSLEGVHQATLLEVVGYKEKAHGYQLEVAGLEATMRGQGRDLAELGARLRQVETELEASQALVLERDQQLLAKQEILQQHQEEITHLGGQLATVRQDLDEAQILHDGQRLELMNGLDQKEAELMRLNQVIGELQDSHAALEREKQAVHGQLSEHRDRLRNLDGLLQEIQDKLRRGSDLARG
ncbi:MAG: response regulator [Holophagaceae bacterium]|nr:response regulator [Holophagaceae bacterium]